MSVQSTMINLCRNVLAVEQKPQGAVNVIIRDIKAGLKVQKKVAQKDFLEACLRKKLFPKDVEAAANKNEDLSRELDVHLQHGLTLPVLPSNGGGKRKRIWSYLE